MDEVIRSLHDDHAVMSMMKLPDSQGQAGAGTVVTWPVAAAVEAVWSWIGASSQWLRNSRCLSKGLDMSKGSELRNSGAGFLGMEDLCLGWGVCEHEHWGGVPDSERGSCRGQGPIYRAPGCGEEPHRATKGCGTRGGLAGPGEGTKEQRWVGTSGSCCNGPGEA